MKLSVEDYNKLKTALDNIVNNHLHEILEHKAKKLGKDVDMRFRWDLLHASKFDVRYMYDYLNDNHIDTALTHYVKNNSLLNS